MESFTWETVTNFDESALIPAPFPRILAQLDAVSPFVEAVITFTAEAIYQPPPADAQCQLPWGPPSAVREWSAYSDSLLANDVSPATALLRDAVHGAVNHAAIGWPVSYGSAPPDPQFNSGNLTDGLTGCVTPSLVYPFHSFPTVYLWSTAKRCCGRYSPNSPTALTVDRQGPDTVRRSLGWI